jgi:hypothetical protein
MDVNRSERIWMDVNKSEWMWTEVNGCERVWTGVNRSAEMAVNRYVKWLWMLAEVNGCEHHRRERKWTDDVNRCTTDTCSTKIFYPNNKWWRSCFPQDKQTIVHVVFFIYLTNGYCVCIRSLSTTTTMDRPPTCMLLLLLSWEKNEKNVTWLRLLTFLLFLGQIKRERYAAIWHISRAACGLLVFHC